MTESSSPRRIIKTGRVVTAKMQKTVVVSVVRTYRHPIYHKILRRTKRYFVHDPHGKCKVGDTVEITDTRPISKQKCWQLHTIIARSST